MSKSAFLTILACSALAGCGTTFGPPPSSGGGSTISAMKYKAKKCPPKCEIGVVVETPPGFTANYLTLKDGEDNILFFPRRGTSRITWTLEARNHAHDRDFAFAVNGINFGAAAIECGYVGSDKTRYSCTFRNDDEPLTVYKYDINVIVVGGAHFDVKPLDPWLIAE